MQMSDTREIGAAPAPVWAGLLDARVLKACVPGRESPTGNPQDGFEAVVAQLGSRLIDGVAKKMADDFFERFQQTVEGPAEEQVLETADAEADGGAGPKGWLRRLIGR
jgi:uncharacterized protein